MYLTKYFPGTDFFSHELSSIFSNPSFDLDKFWDTNVHRWNPSVDIVEDKEEIRLKLEMPGLTAEDVHIDVEKNVLTLKGEKKKEEKTDGENYYCLERSYGCFSRSFELPDYAKQDKIKAEFKNGVLNIRIPKAVEAKPKKIEVAIQ